MIWVTLKSFVLDWIGSVGRSNKYLAPQSSWSKYIYVYIYFNYFYVYIYLYLHNFVIKDVIFSLLQSLNYRCKLLREFTLNISPTLTLNLLFCSHVATLPRCHGRVNPSPTPSTIHFCCLSLTLSLFLGLSQPLPLFRSWSWLWNFSFDMWCLDYLLFSSYKLIAWKIQ